MSLLKPSPLHSTPQYSTQKFWLKHTLPAAIFALLMVLVYPNTTWDFDLTQFFFNAQANEFPFKNNVFLSQFMHTGLKWLMVGIALSCLVLSGAGLKYDQLASHRRSLLWAFIAMLLSTSVVAFIKSKSMHGCPWDLQVFGGSLPLFGLFEAPPIGATAGACFPAGHPSAGYALMAFYFAFKHSKPQFATIMLWIGLSIGLIMGGVQVMRGAHFLSHILWTGWVVWLVLLMQYWLFSPVKRT